MYLNQYAQLAALYVQASATKALADLFGRKHLYQSVEIDLTPARQAVGAEIRKRARRAAVATVPGSEIEVAGDAIDHVVALRWEKRPPLPTGAIEMMLTQKPVAEVDGERLIVDFPTVRLVCSHCKSPEPFNPVMPSIDWKSTRGPQNAQTLIVSYECQNCKTEPVLFLVRRRANKLTLCGRDPIEPVLPNKLLPKEAGRYFGAAQIAHNSGQTLAALFLLRVFVEQFWRSVPAIVESLKKDARMSGDQMASAYQDSLPPAFKERFPSLGEAYGRLSEAIHAADADAALFEGWSEKIVEHFDARRLFKLGQN